MGQRSEIFCDYNYYKTALSTNKPELADFGPLGEFTVWRPIVHPYPNLILTN